MAKTLKRPTTPATKPPRKGAFVADPRREQVFVLYRDLGPGRSFRKLQEAVSVRWPANPLSLGTLSNWSTQFGWKKRIEEYELGQQRATPTTTSQQVPVAGDDVDNLRKAASQALARALQGMSVPITKPGDVKALVDTASKALELADKLKQERTGTATSAEIAEFGRKLLDRIEQARRKDIVTMVKAAVEAACAEAGTTNLIAVMRKAAMAVGMRVNDGGEIELQQGLSDASESDVDVAGGRMGSVDGHLLPQIEPVDRAFTL